MFLRKALSRVLSRRPPAMQVGALCLRDEGREVLLISSRDTGRWIIPKGWPMPGLSLADAAMQEAWEESGVRGHVNQAEIGRYFYDKRQDRGFAIPVEVRVFPIEVDTLAKSFPEANERKRKWFSPEAAADLVDESGLKSLLKTLQPDLRS